MSRATLPALKPKPRQTPFRQPGTVLRHTRTLNLLVPLDRVRFRVATHADDLKVQHYCLMDLEAFEVGTHKGIEYREEHLDEMIRNLRLYGPLRTPDQKYIFEPSARLGHEGPDEQIILLNATGQPAAGWIHDGRRRGGKLFLDVVRIPEQVAQWIKEGLYRFCSIGIHLTPPPGLPSQGMVIDHIAFLGTASPNVKTIKPLTAPEVQTFSANQCQTLPVRKPLGSTSLFAEVTMTRDQYVQFFLSKGVPQATLDKLEDADLAAMYAAAQPAPTVNDDTAFVRADAIAALSSLYPVEELEAKGDEELMQLLAQAKADGKLSDDTKPEGKKDEPKPETQSGKGPAVHSDADVRKIIRQEFAALVGPFNVGLKSVQTKMAATDRLAEARLRKEHETAVQCFCDELVRSRRCTPAQVPAIKSSLLAAPATNLVTFSDGKTKGSSFEELKAQYQAWPVQNFSDDLIPAGSGSQCSEERKRALLSTTPSGRAALKSHSKT